MACRDEILQALGPWVNIYKYKDNLGFHGQLHSSFFNSTVKYFCCQKRNKIITDEAIVENTWNLNENRLKIV